MGESSLDVGTNLSVSCDTINDYIGNPFPTSRTSTQGNTILPCIESLYEVVVVADYWYGYKRVGGSSS